MERLKTKDKMMQPSIFRIVKKKQRHAASAHPLAVRTLIREFQLCPRAGQHLVQHLRLQLLAQWSAFHSPGQFLHNLLHCTGVAAFLRQKKLGIRTQHPVLVEQCIAVQAVRKRIALLFDCIQQPDIFILLFRRFQHLGAVLIDIHILIGLPEQIPHAAGFKIR